MTLGINRIPDGVNPDVPSVARMFDYLLGGGHNFAADRQLADAIEAVMPGTRQLARVTRALKRRVVRFMMSAGVRQFLDFGPGIPTVGCTHELAQQADPQAKVVYVDIDPVAVAHSRMILEGNDRAVVVHADLLEPESVLGHDDTRRLLDFTQPIGLLLIEALNHVPDDKNPRQLLARYRQALASGSYVAMLNLTAEIRPAEIESVHQMVQDTPNQINIRTREQLTALFEGLEMVEPGVVSLTMWRPESPVDRTDGPEGGQALIGVGRKP